MTQPRTDFYAMNARRNAQRNATKTHMVKSVNKDGSVSKMAPTRSDWQLNAFTNSEAAELRARELESMNPGRKFAVVAL